MKEYSNCPVCNEKTFSLYKECKDYTVSQVTFKIVQCDHCEFTFTNPIPLESEIGKYYESDDYVSHSNTSKGLINTLYQIVRNYTLKKKVSLLESLSKDKTLLDIGCGTGEFLNKAQSMGFKVFGIEPSDIARNQAIKNYSLNVENESTVEKLENKSFDFITMWHVLEHVYNLNDRVEQIGRLIKDNGFVIIAVPNKDSFDAEYYGEYWAAYDVPRHLYHFNPKSIRQLFENHGFKMIDVLPMRFDSYYVSMLSEKYKSGKTNLIKAFLTGFKSNFKGKNKNKYSSQVYILSKRE